MRNAYNKLLTTGLSQLKKLEFSDVPKADEIEYTFSDKYIKSKEKLLKKLGHSYWKYVNTVAKKVAIITITLIIAFTSLMTVDAFREKVIDFVYKIYSSFTEIEPNNTSSIIDTYYTFASIPNGFIDSGKNTSNLFSIIYLKNQNHKEIMLTQISLSNAQSFNSEHGTLKETIINNTPCLTCKTATDYFCYWEFDGYRFELIYPLDLGEEFMSEVVGKLVEIDPDELNH